MLLLMLSAWCDVAGESDERPLYGEIDPAGVSEFVVELITLVLEFISFTKFSDGPMPIIRAEPGG